MKGYTIFFITVPILDLFLDYLEGKYLSKVTEKDEMSEALIYRRRYATIRFWVSILLMMGGLVFIVAWDGIDMAGKHFPFLAGWLMGKRKTIIKHQNPVSWKTLEDVKEKDFILYLRGFSSDSYTDIDEASKLKSDKFNEYNFIKFLKYYYPVYAVGMTKELYSPHGASRIYLRDEHWESDVQKLIEKSKMVVILLNNSESCIKEIVHCSHYSEKTLFIIEDMAKLRAVKEYCRKNNLNCSLPLLLPHDGLYSFYCNKNGKFLIPMCNNTKGYAKLIRDYMSSNIGNRRILHNFGISLFAIMIVILVCYFFLSIIIPLPKEINVAFYIMWTVILIMYLFHELPYKTTHRIWSGLNKILSPSQSL